MAECNRCTLIAAVRKMAQSSKISLNEDEKKAFILMFLHNDITFKDLGTKLGLSQEDINEYLPIEEQNRRFDDK